LSEKSKDGGVLVDTSVWIDFFRKEGAISKALEGLILTGRAVVAGVVVFELSQGIRSAEEKTRILDLLSELNYVEMSIEVWQTAGELARSLKSKGLNLPVSDVLLAAVALKHDFSLFTLDRHFGGIPELKRYVPG
jgi:predicted nucleic acid-binding protein